MLVTTVAAGVSQAQAPIDTLALRGHTSFLAHDALQGRAAGSAGERIAAEYIAAQCRRLGLRPAGDDYVRRVPLEEARVLPATRLVVRTAGVATPFAFPDHVLPNLGSKETLVGFMGQAVWVGDSDSLLVQRGLAQVDLRGAVALMVGLPSPAAVETLATRGAVGMLHIIPDDEAFALYRRSRGATRVYHRVANVPSSLLPPLPSVLADVAVGQAILSEGGPFLGAPARPRRLRVRVDVVIALETHAIDSHNVGCLLRGRDGPAADTAVAFTAHLDHLGVGPPDAAGDSIYNGFSDNAAGVAMLLAIAQARAASADTAPRLSWLFLFFGGEERGLLGSDYYVHRPAWPLERIRAVINLDAGAPAAPPVTWRLAGVDSSGLGGVAIAVARQQGWEVTTSAPRPNSDYYPFVRHGIPAVFIIPGPGPYEGLSEEESNALRRRWDRYHQPGDNWHEDFPFSGLARYAEYAYRVALRVDGRQTRR